MITGLVGEKLGHSFSREIHSALGDTSYRNFELKKDELAEFISKREFDGINVTIPYKTDVIPLLDSISDEAKARSRQHRSKSRRKAFRLQHRLFRHERADNKKRHSRKRKRRANTRHGRNVAYGKSRSRKSRSFEH